MDKDGGPEPGTKEEEEPQLEHALWEAKLKFLQVACRHFLFSGFMLLMLQSETYLCSMHLASLEACVYVCTVAASFCFSAQRRLRYSRVHGLFSSIQFF